MVRKLQLVALLAAAIAALAAALPAAGDDRRTAGAPYYLHYGPTGLCISLTNWRSVDGIELDPATRIVSVAGQSGAYNFLDVVVDGQGTSTASDDTVVITLTSYSAGPPDVEELEVDLYLPGSSGGWTTTNTPKELYLKRIEFSASNTDANGVTNDTPIPMNARGFFGSADGVEGFFLGGEGPDCVTAITGKGAGRDNSIDTRGGADNIRSGFGDDSLSGGEGPDTIDAGWGDDKLRGGGDVDHLMGENGSDCYSGSQSDGLRDLLDEPAPGLADVNTYAAEPGVVDGMAVETIEYITEASPVLVTDCVG